MKKVMLTVLCSMLFTTACTLKVANVNAPAVNYVSDQSCKISVTDINVWLPERRLAARAVTWGFRT